MECLTPTHFLILTGRFLILHPEAVPSAGGIPIAEGVAVDLATLTEQHQQFGRVVAVRDQRPGAHGGTVDGVTQRAHVVGGDAGDDGCGVHGFGSLGTLKV